MVPHPRETQTPVERCVPCEVYCALLGHFALQCASVELAGHISRVQISIRDPNVT
jgi:hypothetical protein